MNAPIIFKRKTLVTSKLILNLCFTLFIVVPTISFAQSNISDELKLKMESEVEKLLPIRIEFFERVPLDALKQKMDSGNYNNHQRAKTVMRVLKKQALSSQKEILQFIKDSLKEEVSDVNGAWIVNMISLKATPYAIHNLSKFPAMMMELETSELILPNPIKHAPSPNKKTVLPGKAEPGLVAINARPMWDLGYTGKGKKVFIFDSGVEPTHPAFQHRFLGNHLTLNQSWRGYNSTFPQATNGVHGTHVLGTTAGLDTTTNDTIGMAFNAYWIANDIIDANVANFQSLMIQSYQWALNPDGDTNTTNDIPDVINNSWGLSANTGNALCTGYIPQLMKALEAAGIANIFSAGNNGPNNGIITGLAAISYSQISTFSVGSVDGSVPYPQPISNFSSVGPAICTTDSNSIFPEVVAPGQLIRSSVGKDQYAVYSGTSMASPHVSGAILLLKEAFPNVTGVELLTALFTSAKDLGAMGPDNTFGRGIIDVYAAFQQLSLIYTPIDPKNIQWDLALAPQDETLAPKILCDDVYNASFKITNKGDSTISSIVFIYTYKGAAAFQTFNWNGTLLAGQSTLVTMPTITGISVGDYEVNIQATLAGMVQDYDVVNNHLALRFSKKGKNQLPFFEGFENEISSNWEIQNPDELLTWETTSISGRTNINNSKAVTLQYFTYASFTNQKDALILSEIDLANTTGNLFLAFDIAYQNYTTINAKQDTFRVYGSTDCGVTFDTLLYEKYGADLSTQSNRMANFKPATEQEWRRDTVLLSNLNTISLILKFEGTNRNGNNIYLDNISLFTGKNDPLGFNETQFSSFNIYPTLVADNLTIEADKFVELKIYASNGDLVLSKTLKELKQGINTSNFTNGLYIVKVSNGKDTQTKKFIKR